MYECESLVFAQSAWVCVHTHVCLLWLIQCICVCANQELTPGKFELTALIRPLQVGRYEWDAFSCPLPLSPAEAYRNISNNFTVPSELQSRLKVKIIVGMRNYIYIHTYIYIYIYIYIYTHTLYTDTMIVLDNNSILDCIFFKCVFHASILNLVVCFYNFY